MLPISDQVRAIGERLVTDELIIFPVRHHSPACAWQLHRLLGDIRPSAVLVEGPRSFTPLISMLVDEQARMPLAIYTYAVRRAEGDAQPSRRAAYYPFCDHSPELVALRAAREKDIPARFIDLDFAEQMLIEPEGEDDETESGSLLDESHYRRSRYLTALAARLGCRDHEELWEHLFEVPGTGRSLHEHVLALAAYCHLARSEYDDAGLTADGTLQREAEMAWHIRQALKDRKAGEGPVLAVMGGFHAVAMPFLLRRDGDPPSRPAISRKDIADEASALIRYSFDRLDRLNGYAAGMTSPAWQQLLWERMTKLSKALPGLLQTVRNEAALTVLFDIAADLRQRHGMALPMPAMEAAYEQALRLAQLRGRAAPARDDVLDAVTSCFVKGDADAEGALVLAVAQRVLSGETMGRVPPDAGTPPLVKDFQHRAYRQRLKIDDSAPRRIVLDIYRRPEHRVTSRLLHGLSLLGVPLAVRTAGPDFVAGTGLDRLQEHWEYSYSAATEAALVEASVYGVTVSLAVTNRFLARLERLEADGQGRSARAGSAMLVHACLLGLHDHVPRIVAALRQQIAGDPAFDAVVVAASSIGLLCESREPLEAREVEGLPELLQAAYERAIYLGRELGGQGGDAGDTVQALARLRELLVSSAGEALDANLYWSMIAALHAQHGASLIRGAAGGLLYSAGRISDAALGVALQGHLTGMAQPRDAVSFLRGLLSTAREAAWQQEGLLSVIDALLGEWDDRAFIAVLPELRLAFAEMTPKETDRIAESVARLHGQDGLGRLVHYELAEEQVQANLAISEMIAGILVRDGLQEWMAQ
jgi:hypothetical protein